MSTPHATRRQNLIDALGPSSALILASPEPVTRSHDTHYRYRTDSDLYYLTGFAEPGTILVITPGHDEGDVHLFVRPRDALKEQWDGYRVGPLGVEQKFGMDRGHLLDDFEATLPNLLARRQAVYHTDGYHQHLDHTLQKVIGQMRKTRHKHDPAPSQFHDVRRLLKRMRALKDDSEIVLIRASAEIASQAHQLAMGATQPGMHEYQIQALIEYHFTSQGAMAPAYETIVASGAHANILHYIENHDVLKEGDLVLVDAGCEYRYYASDITRTWPVSGTFSAAQRDLYQAVLTLQLELLALCAVHPTIEDLATLTTRRSVELLKDLKVLKGDTDQLIEDKAHKLYAPHGFGHWLGLDVHDVSPYQDARGSVRLHAGHVLTIEPGLYIPAHAEHVPSALRGQGVRIEDDVLITSDGMDVLTSTCPKHIDDIEALVGSKISHLT